MIWNRKLRQENNKLRRKLAAYEKALTPSPETKYRHSNRYEFDVELYDTLGEYHYDYEFTVPWTTVKEIMNTIRKEVEDEST